jgi:CDP-glycerol glycerophosphotransferase (TagB/SpsB family)
LPSTLNLLVKPHPNTILRNAPQLERLIGKTERSNLQFLTENFPIFALLERCDAYLGDRSSIGYDYLLLDKPLFFLDPHHHPKGRDLLGCGQSVTPETLFPILSHPDRYSAERKKMAAYAFDHCSEALLRETIR